MSMDMPTAEIIDANAEKFHRFMSSFLHSSREDLLGLIGRAYRLHRTPTRVVSQEELEKTREAKGFVGADMFTRQEWELVERDGQIGALEHEVICVKEAEKERGER